MDSPSPFAPDYVRNPHEVYARLRNRNAACYVGDLGMWVISRYDDVRAVLRDAETFGNSVTLAPVIPECPQAREILRAVTNDRVTAAADGPSHARTRRALIAVFPSTPHKAARWEPAIRAIARRLVDQMAARGAGDLVHDVARTLPLRLISAVFGDLDEDCERIRTWSDGRAELVGGVASETAQVVHAAETVRFWEYSQQLVSRRSADPGDDVVSALLEYRAGEDAILTEREIASIAFDLLGAVYETMSSLFANSVFQTAVQRCLGRSGRRAGAHRPSCRGGSAIRPADRWLVAVDDQARPSRRRRHPGWATDPAAARLGQSR